MIDTLKRLYSTDEGVSSVVGVVLLTGVVVVSVSSAGAFMIQNFEQQSSVQPLSSIQFEESRSFVTDGNKKTYDYTRVKIAHRDGEPIPTNELSITVAGSPAYDVTGDVGGSGEVQLADPFEEYGSLLSIGSPSFEVGDSISIYAAIHPDTVPPDRVQQNGAAIVNPPSVFG